MVFLDPINLKKFVDVNVDPAEGQTDTFFVSYASGVFSGPLTEEEACALQRSWRLAHARHPMTGEPLLGLLQDLVGLADEAVTSRETDPDEDDTEEMSAAHRQTVNDGEALCQALKDH